MQESLGPPPTPPKKAKQYQMLKIGKFVFYVNVFMDDYISMAAN